MPSGVLRDRKEAAREDRHAREGARNRHRHDGRGEAERKAASIVRSPTGTRTPSSTSCTSRPSTTSSGDGVGDFAGLMQRLDYVQGLGVNTIWLLPFYPSPLRDDGYDIADYLSVHPSYGDLDQFKAFIEEAHRRGIRVITELVINHTSDQHPWFQAARQAAPRLARAQLLRLERHRHEVQRHPHHLHRQREVELDLGRHGGRLFLAPLLLASARSQLRQPGGVRGGHQGAAASGSTSASTGSGWMRCPTCASARAPTTRTWPRRTRS